MSDSKKLDFNTEQLTDEHMAEMEKHAGFNQANIKEHYNDLCANYEQIYLKVGFPDPKQAAEYVQEFVSNNTEERRDQVEVLDMGCGTGLVGKYLGEYGFTNIDGVDASTGMLAESREKGVYRSLDELFLG